MKKRTGRTKRMTALILAAFTAATMTGCNEPTVADPEAPITVTWYAPVSTQPDLNLVMDEVNKITMEKVNARIDLKIIDSGAYDERMKMNMASGSDFDLCYVGYINKYPDAVEKGGLYCLDDFLEGSQLEGSLPDFAWDDSRVNGKIYAVPNYQIMAGSMCLTVNKELAEKYNLDPDSIRKTADIEPFLEQIKQNEPHLYPLSLTSKRNTIHSLDENPYIDVFFEYKGSYAVAAIANQDGTVVVKPVTEIQEQRDAADLLHDWFKKGYIRRDVASVTDDANSSDQKAGKYAVMSMTYKPGVESTIEKQWGYAQIPIRVSPAYVRTGSVRTTMTGIGAKSKNPEAAFKIMELMNTDKELFNLFCFGIEGKHYEKIGPNKVRTIDNSGYSLGYSAWTFGNQFNAFVMEGQDDDVWEKTVEFNDSAPKSKLLGFIPDTQPIRTEISQCQTVIGEYQVLENGSEDPEKYWDEYVSKMTSAGVHKIASELQRQIDEFLAANQ